MSSRTFLRSGLNSLFLSFSLLLALVSPPAAQAQIGFSHTEWSNDASTGISTQKTQWAYMLGGVSNTASINGVNLTTITGGAAAVSGRFSMSGTLGTHDGHTNVLTANVPGTGSATMSSHFTYGGDPAVISVQGLTVGRQYTFHVYGVGFGGPRTCRWTSGSHSMDINEAHYGNTSGIRVDYTFVASDVQQEISVAQLGQDSWHFHGIALDLNPNTDPTDITLSNSSVAENSPANTAVGTLSATDADAGAVHTFSIVAGAGDTDNASFTLSGDTLTLIPSANFEAKSSYSVRVQAADAAGGVYAEALTVSITDVNEPPTDISLSATSIAENNAANATVGTLSASGDPDAGATHTFSLVSGSGSSENSSFNIQGNALRLTGVANFENKASYSVRVQASDGSGGTFQKVFTITVTNVNEAPTGIALSSTSIFENNAANATVGTLSATGDQDAGDSHTFSLVSGTGSGDNASFTITGATLKLTPVANFEAQLAYLVRVQVSDAAGATFARSFTITVGNVNDAPSGTDFSRDAPAGTYQFTASDFGFSDPDVPESTFTSVKITTLPTTGTLTTTAGAAVTAGQSFAVGAALGQNWSSYGALPALSAISTATSDDGTKVAIGTSESVWVTANSGANWLLYTPSTSPTRPVAGVAMSSNGNRIYAAVTGGGILVSTNNGSNWNFKASTQAWSSVACSANGLVAYAGTLSSGTIYKTVDGGNSWTTLATTASSVNALDCSADGSVVLAGCNDRVLVSQNSGGSWSLALLAPLNYKGVACSADGTVQYAISAYSLIQVSTNSGTNWTSKDSSRNWTGVSCSSTGTEVLASVSGGNLYASSNTGDTWTQRDASRLWSSVAVSGNGTRAFASVSGAPTAAVPVYSTSAVTSELPLFTGTVNTSFTFQVGDGGGTANGGVNLDPTPNTATLLLPPADITLSPSSVAENSAISTLVGNLTAVNTATSFEIVAGSGDTHNDSFSISGTELRLIDELDYEKGTSLSVRVRATNNLGTFSKALTVTVTDVNEPAKDMVLSGSSIPENNLANATVGTLSATGDPEVGQTHTFNFVSGTGSTDNSAFSISGNELRLTGSANFEVKNSYSVRVAATDSGSPATSIEKTFTVSVTDVNEAPTGISLSAFSLAENNAANATVATISALGDPDAGASHSFSLVAGTGDTDNASFNISGSALRLTGSADFEVQSSYALRLRADDGLGGAYEKEFSISITNVNDLPTDICLSSSTLAENNAANATVGTLAALGDPDLGETHSFSLVSGTGSADNGSFTISGSSLQLTPSANYEVKTSYSVRVQATDSKGASVAKAFTVTIVDLNEAPTAITLSANTLAENNAENATVGTLSATGDPDVGASHSFSLINGVGSTDNASFIVEGNSLKITAVADFETKSSYSVRVQADDGNGGTFARVLTVTVTNVNEAPVDVSLSGGTVGENNATNAIIGTLTAADPDVGATHTFSLVPGTGGTDNSSFTVDGNSLKITVVADFETKSSYSVRVQADDGAGGQFAKAFTVTVLNASEAPFGSDKTINLAANVTHTFSNSDWGFGDSDSPANVFSALKITALPSLGLLQVDGDNVATNQTVSLVGGPAGQIWTESGSVNIWRGMASSADGRVILVGSFNAGLYVSTDYGTTWSASFTTGRFEGVAVSDDGTKLVAGRLGSHLYTSTDSGSTWTARMTDANRSWYAMTSSSDGTKLAATVDGGFIYTSTDSGVSWTARMTDAGRAWKSIDSSADGTQLVAGHWNGNIYTSSDSGVNWTAQASSKMWSGVTSSADGTKLAAAAYNQGLYTSTDSGATWTFRGLDIEWAAIDSTSDGSMIVASATGRPIYISTDSGMNWTARASAIDWSGITVSNDGSRIAAAAMGLVHLSSSTVSEISFTPDKAGSTSFTFQVQDDGASNNLDATPNTITLNVAPVVTASTTSLNMAVGLTIQGFGFDSNAANNTVVFAPTGSGTVTAATATSLTVTGLTGFTAGPVTAIVTTNGVSSGSAVQVATLPATNANLTALSLSDVTFSPAFSSDTTAYTGTVSNPTASTSVTPTQEAAGATIQVRVNGGSFATVVSGVASSTLSLNIGSNTVDVRVTAQDGTTTKTYTVTVTRQNVTQTAFTGALSTFATSAGLPANAAPSADSDGDGKTNLEEFAFGTNPNSNGSGTNALAYTGTFAAAAPLANGQPVANHEPSATGTDYRAVFNRRVDHTTTGLTYTVQFSANLSTWSTSSVTPTVLATSGDYQLVSVKYPLFVGGRPARFFRIIVNQP